MHLHAPAGYRGPFLDLIEGAEVPGALSTRLDVFYRDAQLTAFIAAAHYQEVGDNALIVPNVPYENLYVLPDEPLCALHRFSKRLALAFGAAGATGCCSVSTTGRESGCAAL